MDAPFRRIELVNYDIAAMRVDAIVNAANSMLRCGGGVDGAIHRAAGARLGEECLKLGGCPTGEARLTPGYELSAGHVIHAVGPVYRDGAHGEPALLRSCYEHALTIASLEKFRTIAFPAISCGAYGYPLAAAADIAVATVLGFMENNEFPERVFFCCREADVYLAYERRIEQADLT
jgi:O-acetyl-ADP-ribose deacetylase (regulator of RNase III)